MWFAIHIRITFHQYQYHDMMHDYQVRIMHDNQVKIMHDSGILCMHETMKPISTLGFFIVEAT